jgi:hypothetical protein
MGDRIIHGVWMVMEIILLQMYFQALEIAWEAALVRII